MAAAVAVGLVAALVLSLPRAAAMQSKPVQTSEINLGLDAYSVDENAGALVVTITLTPPGSQQVTVDFSTNMNGNAEAGVDYIGVRRRLAFPPGTTQVETEVPIVDDRLVEGDETFEISLNAPQNAVLGNRATATVHILNDDVARLRVEDVDAWEDAGGAVITVTQSTTSTLQTYVHIYTEDDSAVAGEDYEAIPPLTLLNIPPGARTATLAIALYDNDLIEPNKQFRVRLADPLNAVIERDTATVTLLDDDGLPTLRVDDATAMEGDGAMHFTLTLDRAAEIAVQIDYATEDDSATSPDDYIQTSGQAKIPIGASAVTVSVPLVDDSLVEGDERFYLVLSKVVGANAANDRATGTIQDDDPGSSPRHRVYLPGILVE